MLLIVRKNFLKGSSIQEQLVGEQRRNYKIASLISFERFRQRKKKKKKQETHKTR